MATEVEKLIDDLDNLVKINNDRTHGYQLASQDIEDLDLKSLFSTFVKESESFADQLGEIVKHYGQTPSDSGTTAGKLHQTWLDLKAKIVGKDRESILSSCQTGDKTAIEAYETVLDHEKVKALPEVYALLSSHREVIQQDLLLIESLQQMHSNS
ncbi:MULTISPECIES: PA2169 family four-helix-bundle protein [unclassified Siphonobacter]|uniref:ferritin-like domain-containing protein n=1 Tax=unclassified Siphonobacter TaxID=2635712 RepID=UPI000CC394FC|nr:MULTISPECIES: PA2169 family four-helix-bundle protein [unclassified Siphonobacter]MDQ1086848.1 uncharacterized protein (TIGR02284 family) [Siphonobacter sp. SORGH_AS_1065]MDR6192956.1 uncharacterized protein (TIGR02284 family) [Siphonobacter sp. SORGH_AS_0500]PKK35753.1 hypothetical protein BWI96_15735 [Siphonobacter sp. SORGH_AS_0500]